MKEASINKIKTINIQIASSVLLIIVLFFVFIMDAIFTYICFAWDPKLNFTTGKLLLSCFWLLFLILLLANGCKKMMQKKKELENGSYSSLNDGLSENEIQKKQVYAFAKPVILGVITIWFLFVILDDLHIV